LVEREEARRRRAAAGRGRGERISSVGCFSGSLYALGGGREDREKVGRRGGERGEGERWGEDEGVNEVAVDVA
jgi:hypothetical protein